MLEAQVVTDVTCDTTERALNTCLTSHRHPRENTQ